MHCITQKFQDSKLLQPTIIYESLAPDFLVVSIYKIAAVKILVSCYMVLSKQSLGLCASC